MIPTWVWAVVWCALYLIVGAVFARSCAVDVFRRAKRSYEFDSIARDAMHMTLVMRALAWPGFMVFDVVRATVLRWVTAPVDRRQERVESLRADAKAWRTKAWSGAGPDRRVANDIADTLEQLAREAEL